MKKLGVFLLIGILAVVAIPFTVFAAGDVIKMSTTTSTQASGLLDVLLPKFTEETGIQVKVFVHQF